jgi:hypothetical protein
MKQSRVNPVATLHSNLSRIALLGVTLALSACGGDDHDRVYFTPVNYEYGLIAVDLNADGRSDIVSAATLYTPGPPYESGYLRTWLHNTATTFAAPVSYRPAMMMVRYRFTLTLPPRPAH